MIKTTMEFIRYKRDYESFESNKNDSKETAWKNIYKKVDTDTMQKSE
jgi:hypothetical protein